MLELCALAALGYWGFQTGSGLTGWALGLGALLAMAVVWGAFVSPKASFRLEDPLRLALEVAIFVCATAVLLQTGQTLLALIFAASVAVNLGVMLVFHQRGS